MLLSTIASIVEQTATYSLCGIRQSSHYITVDIGVINSDGHPSPICPFVVSTLQLANPVDGAEYIRVLTRETCEKLKHFAPQCAVHPYE